MNDRLFSILSRLISRENIRAHAEKIHLLEGNESYCNYKASTDYVIRMLEESGFEHIERIALPADGKTAFFDCVMPQAWETTGRSFIRLEDNTLDMDDRLLADSDRDPFNSGIWGAPTPDGGVDCEIVDFRTARENAAAIRGKLVLMDGFSQEQYRYLAQNDVTGVIISDSKAGEDYPDYCRWCNAIGFSGWYSTAEDRRIPIFSITPRRCAFLRRRLAQGTLMAHAEAKCRIYDGEIYSVTGIIPGESKEELTLLAHMYEPFLQDDAAGVAVAAELCRCLKALVAQKQLPAFKKTLRIVLSMERYGFSHFFSDTQRNKKTLAAFSFDSCCHILGNDSMDFYIRISSMLQPTFMDLFLPNLVRHELPCWHFITEKGTLSDDTFCSDDFIGVPSMWIHGFNPRYHHNSGPAFMDADWNLAGEVAAIMGTLIGKLATGGRSVYQSIIRKCEKLACKFMADKCVVIQHELENGKLSYRDAKEKIHYFADKLVRQLHSVRRFYAVEISKEPLLKIRRLAASAIKKIHAPNGKRELLGIQKAANQIRVTRLRPGTLMSLPYVPQPERHNVDIPDLLYVLLDAKRTLFEAVKLYEYETDLIISESQLKTIVDELRYLEKYGYVKIVS